MNKSMKYIYNNSNRINVQKVNKKGKLKAKICTVRLY